MTGSGFDLNRMAVELPGALSDVRVERGDAEVFVSSGSMSDVLAAWGSDLDEVWEARSGP